MDTAYTRFVRLQRELEADPEYALLERRRNALEPRFLAVLGTLPEEHRAVVMEYLGICAELGERETEIVCFLP